MGFPDASPASALRQCPQRQGARGHDSGQRAGHPEGLQARGGLRRPGWVASFAEGGTFTDESTGIVYRGPDEWGILVEVYKTAFSDMHRELYRFYTTGDIVVVQLALQGTHDGPLKLLQGTIPPTGRRMDAPCADVFEVVDGRIKRFDCYPSGTVILTQLGVLGDLAGALVR